MSSWKAEARRNQNRGGAVNQKLFDLATNYAHRLQSHLGESLVSVVLFGSVARGEAEVNSDIDLLIVAEGLPRGRFARLNLLEGIDQEFQPLLERLEVEGTSTRFSRILKTRKEAGRIIPLYLDLVEDAVILYDADGFFQDLLRRLRDSLNRLGAKRERLGRVRYWDLKPDLVPGERFEI
jgi:predicted nucleotidyltransferase